MHAEVTWMGKLGYILNVGRGIFPTVGRVG